MRTTWKKVRLGEVLTLDLDRVAVDASQTYPMVGVYSFGRGLFDREPIEAGKTSYRHFYRLKANHVIMSQLFGWEGALAISSPQFAGKFVSPQFPTFLCNKAKLDRLFLNWLMKRPMFWEDLGSRASGMGDRRRTLNPDALFACEIPLPSLAEQRRIVARIEELADKIAEAISLRHQAVEEAEALSWSAKTKAFPTPNGSTVGSYVRFQTGYAFKSEWFTKEGVRLARNANVGHGELDWSETVRLPESCRSEFGKFELEEDDILVSLDRPIISTGVKVARVKPSDLPSLLLQRVARAQFDRKRLDSGYLFHWFTSPCFVTAIDPGRSNGVPHISHKDIERIPFGLPPLEEQRRIVVYLDGLQAKVNALKKLQAETAAELDAMLPSVLDKAFKGEF